MAFCKNCGKHLRSDALECSSCGTKVIKSQNKDFEEDIEENQYELEKKGNLSEIEKLKRKIDSIKIGKTDAAKRRQEDKKIEIIRNFPIPNKKEDIIELMLLAASYFDLSFYETNIDKKDVSDAWLAKVEQCYQKAKWTFSEQEDLGRIKEIYDKIIADSKKIDEKGNERRKKKTRRSLLIIFSSIFAFVALITSTVLVSTNACSSDPNAIKAGIASSSCEGMYYQDLVDIFEKQGFVDIVTHADGWNLFKKSGTVKKVTIDGDSEFYRYSKYAKDAKIIILYYS